MTRSRGIKEYQLQPLRDVIQAKRWEALDATVEAVLAAGSAAQQRGLLIRMAGLLQQVKPEAAVRCYERALPSLQGTLRRQVCSNLAMILGRLKRYGEAKKYGEEAIMLRDREFTENRLTKRLVVFSLYGSDPAYCEPLVINAQKMAQLYPGWVMRVYHDDSVPQHVLARLQALSVECVHAAEVGALSYPGTFWRFLALEEDCDAVIFRDADSVIDEREQYLVNEWLDSGKAFHVIRDWYGHNHLILAGLWGARYGLLAGIRLWIERFLRNGNLDPKFADQEFLQLYVWPRIKHDCLHHSSVYDLPGAQWPSGLPRHYVNPESGRIQPLGSWLLQEYRPDTDRPYTVCLYDEEHTLICRYDFAEGKPYSLPSAYAREIERGRWRVEVIEQTDSAAE
ncbi:hypothetical protein [Neisseria perflava]|uniref:hypothetical protein n=1 Tax=Neisseria perflava TaxID=33053 RepID=UPI0020A0809D|nr:hypothetical protein [Neisseria perflava]MCP1660486.1 hypothetical protein [Neisseria perflava]MCP1772035.1 hypothetical protein [Neisseria perflava]